ncbi:ribosome biosynthesis protein NIP7 [Aspergillus lucknowensis]|uniref:60S ribosome subunit biogenesis protein NIP7 n=1 Tax=Aspergillus lucknowensis TaxID=176173 RepID=A0ABR4L6X1_9EURO
MRPLTEEETQTLFKKLAEYTGSSLKNLIAPLDNSPNADRYVFRLSHNRVYYVRLSLANLATSVPRDNLLSLGICMGKFTKTNKFRLHITALPILAEHARNKIYIRPNGVMPFLYGSNVSKAHVATFPDNLVEHQGIIVCTQDDVPLGFGITARSTAEARRLDPTAVVCFRQADCGEYLRDEDTLFASG